MHIKVNSQSHGVDQRYSSLTGAWFPAIAMEVLSCISLAAPSER